MRKQVSIYRNSAPGRKLAHSEIRHAGTVQKLYWIGPILVVLRNRKSARAILDARKANHPCIGR